MRKIILMFGLISSLAQASMPNLNQNIQCLDAGGYYGTLDIVRAASGMVQVKASQGFAWEITNGLQYPKGREASDLLLQFHPSSCRTLNNLLHCAGMVLVESQSFGKKIEVFKADTYLRLQVAPSAHEASLMMKVAGTTRVGSSIHKFALPLGDCINPSRRR